jgi:hypothetical protein
MPGVFNTPWYYVTGVVFTAIAAFNLYPHLITVNDPDSYPVAVQPIQSRHGEFPGPPATGKAT